jgi:hypothetical protein
VALILDAKQMLLYVAHSTPSFEFFAGLQTLTTEKVPTHETATLHYKGVTMVLLAALCVVLIGLEK